LLEVSLREWEEGRKSSGARHEDEREKGFEEGGKKTEDIQIAHRIIADVKALLTCVPYLSSASNSLSTRLLVFDNQQTSYRKPHALLSERGLNSLVSYGTR